MSKAPEQIEIEITDEKPEKKPDDVEIIKAEEAPEPEKTEPEKTELELAGDDEKNEQMKQLMRGQSQSLTPLIGKKSIINGVHGDYLLKSGKNGQTG